MVDSGQLFIEQIDGRAAVKSVGSDLGFVKWPSPILETVLGTPPPKHRLFAQFASEAADDARLPFLRGAIDRLA